jgi:small-conductance mechanosensitive channel/CRP-like cAMP-binding protein
MSGFWANFQAQEGMAGFQWVALAFVVFSFLLGAWLPERRAKLRNTVLLFAVACLGLAVSAPLYKLGLSSREQTALYKLLHWASLLMAWIAFINVVTVLLDYVLLRVLRIELPRLLHDLLLALAYVIAALSLLTRVGADLTGIVATSAVITAVVAFALQDTLGNVIGGVALQLESTIRVDDWIRVNDKFEGRVTEIRWRQTSIETRDWDTVVIPNSFLLKNQVVILGRREGLPRQHRMWVYFNVDFRYPPVDVIYWVEKALQAEPIADVAAVPPPHCIVTDFRESYITYAARYWLTDLALTDPTNSVVRSRIYAALKRANIPLSIPAQTVFVTEDDAARKKRKSEEELQKRVSVLKSVEFLQSLTAEELRHLAEHLHFAPFVRGEAVMVQGATAHSLYLLTDGQAEVRVTAEGGKLSTVVARLEPGDFFGEMGLMTGEPRSASVVALTDAECYRLDKDAFRDVVQRRPEMLEDVSHILTRRRVELEAAREELNEEAKQQRLARGHQDLLDRIRNFFSS